MLPVCMGLECTILRGMYLVLGNQMVMVVVLNRTDFYVRIFRLADHR